AFRLNVYMNGPEHYEHIDYTTFGSDGNIDDYIADTKQYGFDTLFVHVCNNWFELGARTYDEHNSEDPDPDTFARLDNLIKRARIAGVRVHIWAWGDEQRHLSPVGVGGINGIPDRRIQRYIAARLGPLPGWTMGYGYDLHEWVTNDQVGSWAGYLHQHFGWQHMLWARDRFHAELDASSYPDIANENGEPFSYDDAVANLNSDTTRPHFYGERFWLHRTSNTPPGPILWTEEATRRALWDYTMAGGMGSWWGFFWFHPDQYSEPRWWYHAPPYPNLEHLVTVNTFWEDRFLLDMERANSLTDGYCLKTTTNDNYVFYKENTSSVQMNLSGMATALPAIAVDTINGYAETDMGTLSPSSQTWNAPYVSDWAIAVGDFD
ncbi:MAG: hypothetical protein KAJ52_04075, partial [Sedimentisphaerales bacterium]|nr:hypothetical protein [Sedimentisphaerales bacterium]